MAKRKASDEIKMDIQRTIMSGKYKPGSKLPSERELAVKYNISRVPIREAINELAQKGILRTEPYVGTFVTDLENINLFEENLYSAPRIDRKILIETLKTRILMESEGAGCAAVNADQDEIELIQKYFFDTVNEFSKVRQFLPNAFAQADYNFHKAIADASHSAIISSYMEINIETINMHELMSLHNDSSAATVPNAHLDIYNAILNHDPEAARGTMRDHIERTYHIIMETLDVYPNS